uniref:Uncharacterized protein n=1 Tax=Panagrolaimus superbus TaxID=310955 RepID=A0A914Z8L4_9BILA
MSSPKPSPMEIDEAAVETPLIKQNVKDFSIDAEILAQSLTPTSFKLTLKASRQYFSFPSTMIYYMANKSNNSVGTKLLKCCKTLYLIIHNSGEYKIGKIHANNLNGYDYVVAAKSIKITDTLDLMAFEVLQNAKEIYLTCAYNALTKEDFKKLLKIKRNTKLKVCGLAVNADVDKEDIIQFLDTHMQISSEPCSRVTLCLRGKNEALKVYVTEILETRRKTSNEVPEVKIEFRNV